MELHAEGAFEGDAFMVHIAGGEIGIPGGIDPCGAVGEHGKVSLASRGPLHILTFEVGKPLQLLIHQTRLVSILAMN